MGTSKPNSFRVGELYTHEEIYTRLKVGNAGGIRPSVGKRGENKRLVIMTSDPSAKILRENPYHDRVEGDVLVYTAAGLEGHHEISGINRRLLDQRDILFPIYGFYNIGSRRNTKLGQRRWRFLGLLQYLRHFRENQVDVRGQRRDSVVFELLIHAEPSTIPVDHDHKISVRVCKSPRQRAINEKDEHQVERTPPGHSPLMEHVDSVAAESARLTLLSLPPPRFEHVVKKALEATGFDHVTVTRYTGDGGIDVNAFAGAQLWPFRGGMLQVQAKRWLHTVGRREVAELRGSMQPQAHGALVTTSFYSKAAITEATDPAKKLIVLVNGLEFAAVLLRAGCAIAD